MSGSRVDRILAMATERGPLGVTQHDFDRPARDHGTAIKDIATVIARAGLKLERVYTADGTLIWLLPQFVPDEYMRSGWGCVACGARHTSDWPRDVCGRCEGGPLIRVRVVSRRTHQEACPA